MNLPTCLNNQSDLYPNWRFDDQNYPIYVPISSAAVVAATSVAARIFHKSRSVTEKFRTTRIYSQTKLRKDLKAWWLAYQKQNVFFQDINTGRYSGRLINTYWKSSNSKNSAIGELVFNGSTSYANCGKVDSGNFFTISAWVKFNSLTADRIIISNNKSTNDGAQYDMRYDFTNNSLTVQYISGVNVRRVRSTGFTFSKGTWYHLVWVNSNNSDAGQTLYVNGVKLSTVGNSLLTPVMPANSSCGNTLIGNSDVAASGFFDGSISEVVLWGRTLSSQEIRQLYDATRQRYVGILNKRIQKLWRTRVAGTLSGATSPLIVITDSLAGRNILGGQASENIIITTADGGTCIRKGSESVLIVITDSPKGTELYRGQSGELITINTGPNGHKTGAGNCSQTIRITDSPKGTELYKGVAGSTIRINTSDQGSALLKCLSSLLIQITDSPKGTELLAGRALDTITINMGPRGTCTLKGNTTENLVITFSDSGHVIYSGKTSDLIRILCDPTATATSASHNFCNMLIRILTGDLGTLKCHSPSSGNIVINTSLSGHEIFKGVSSDTIRITDTASGTEILKGLNTGTIRITTNDITSIYKGGLCSGNVRITTTDSGHLILGGRTSDLIQLLCSGTPFSVNNILLGNCGLLIRLLNANLGTMYRAGRLNSNLSSVFSSSGHEILGGSSPIQTVAINTNFRAHENFAARLSELISIVTSSNLTKANVDIFELVYLIKWITENYNMNLVG